MSIDWEFSFDFASTDAEVKARYPIALAKGMEHVRGVAVPLTPELSGHLRGSAGVTIFGDEGHLTFPGPYARYQHYMLDLKHTVGQALYLEQPMVTEAQKVLQIVADTLGEAL